MNSSKPLAWDYTALAATYDHRPDYDAGLVRALVDPLRLRADDPVLDVGAGTGKLTGLLSALGLRVIACEPNSEMLRLGSEKSPRHAAWMAGAGEALPIAAGSIALVTFGSSFNVVPAAQALDECARVLRPDGHWLALWNHRDLDDPLQREVEAIILRHVPHYDYGRRRQDPSADVARNGAFAAAAASERRFTVTVRCADWLDAWQSHATLLRQAGPAIRGILDELRALIGGASQLSVPYYTRAWIARRRHT